MTTPALFSDHSDLSTLTQVVQGNADLPLVSRFGANQQFWATPERPGSDPTTETMEIALISPQLVNWLQFDLAHYPQTVAVEYFDVSTGEWTSLLDPTGTALVRAIRDSVPQVIPPTSSVTGPKHPQHAYMGHWQTLEMTCQPTQLQRVRLKLLRINSDGDPLDVYGNKIDYSLAVRNFSLGYQVADLTDVPRTLPESGSDYASFANSHDVVTSNVAFALRKLDALNVLGEGESDIIWRSATQPDPNCVVCLYADLRDEDGNPQVIDRIFIDPVNNGAHITLYYAVDPAPAAQFVSPDEPLLQAVPNASPNIVVDQAGAHLSPAPQVQQVNFASNGDAYRIPDPYPTSIVLSAVVGGTPTTFVKGTDYTVTLGASGITTVTRLDSGSIPVDGTLVSVGYSVQYSIILDNSTFNYDVGLPWWIGMVIRPSFAQPVDVWPPNVPQDPPWTPPGGPSSITNVIFDCGYWNLAVVDTGFLFSTAAGQTFTLTVAYALEVDTTVFVSYDGTSYTLWVSSAVDTESITVPASSVPPRTGISALAIGSNLERTSFGQVDLASLVIKEEPPPPDGSSYAADPAAFTSVTSYAADEPPGSHYNAVLRFDPTTPLQSLAYPWCIFGGNPSKYAAMSWTPIPRDYTMQRGWMELPPIQASFICLEFTHLQASYADVYEPQTLLAQRFPMQVLTEYASRLAADAMTANDPGLAQQEDLSTFSAYTDNPTNVSTGGTGLGYTNTEVYLPQDALTSDRLYAAKGASWSYRQWQSTQSAPRFFKTGPHAYVQEQATRTAKVGYGVGLRRISFGRQTYSSQYDTPQYEDMFYDQANLASSTWIYDPDHQALNSGSSGQVSATSVTMASNRDVRAVQFAAQQSPAQQLLTDADFADESESNWSASGGASLGPLLSSPAFGNLLPVTRLPRSGTWGDADGNYPTYGAAVTAGVTYGVLSAVQGLASSGADGVQSVAVAQPAGGYLYAAARVISDVDLQAPLWLQIYDPTAGLLLAEAPYTVRRGQICEWSAVYRVGTGLLPSTGVTWGDLVGKAQTGQSYADSFHRSNSSTLGTMDSGQSWTPESEIGAAALQIASNQATVTTAYPAQASVVDVGTVWGTLSVTLGPTYTPLASGSPSAVPLIELGGYWFTSDNRVIDSNTGEQKLSIPGATAGSVLSFQFKPTSLLTHAENPSSVEANLRSWAIAVYLNGSLVGSVIATRGLTSVRGLTGPAGMTFTAFSWTPRTDVPVAPPVIYEDFPGSAEIAGSSTDPNTGNVTITTNDGRTYLLSAASTYTLDYSTPAGGNANGFTAAAGQLASARIDSGTVEGVLGGWANPAASATDPSTWKMLLLDDTGTSHLSVTGTGTLIRTAKATGDTTLKTNVWANGSAALTGESYRVIFISVDKLPADVISGFSVPTTNTQALVFMIGDTITAVYSGNGVFASTNRGIMAYDGAVMTGLSWSPILGVVNAIPAGGSTWGDVDGDDTLTWGDVENIGDQPIVDAVQVRLIQKTTTQDTWLVNSLGIFYDPITWEFSNDGGSSWVPAAEVRNNPDGALLFAPKAADPKAVANQLSYRLTSYAPGTWVSNLVIRPWYRGYARDVPARPAQPHGPNLNPRDHYAPVSEDPHWMVWNKPIPREWYFIYRQLLPNIVSPTSKLPMISERISVDD